MTTTRYAALLRGVNVGGARKVPMAELRTVLTGLGHQGRADLPPVRQRRVQYLPDAREEDLAADLEAALEERFGFPHRLPRPQRPPPLRAVVDACPLSPAADLEPRQLHVTYFSAPCHPPERFASVDRTAFLPEDFRPAYARCTSTPPDGLGCSKLADALARPALLKGVTATTRNWNTVVKLAEMAGPQAP